MNMRKSFHYFQLGLSIFLVLAFAYSLDVKEAIRPINHVGWLYISAAMLLSNVDRMLMAYKWNILLRAKGIIVPFYQVIRSYYLGTFWGTFLPASVGGDIVRGYQLAAQTKSTMNVVSSIIIERMLGVLATLLVGGLGATLFVFNINRTDWTLMVSILSVLCVCSILGALSFNATLLRAVKQLIPSRMSRWAAFFDQFHDSYQTYAKCPGALLRFALWSVLEQFIPIICVFCIAQALGLSASIWAFVMFVPIILALSRIPVAIDGFGIREGLYVYFFSLIGMATSKAFILGFLSHVVGILALLPAFYYFACYFPSPAAAGTSLSR
jgi:uncharacterized protein (TIRG00374 family)